MGYRPSRGPSPRAEGGPTSKRLRGGDDVSDRAYEKSDVVLMDSRGAACGNAEEEGVMYAPVPGPGPPRRRAMSVSCHSSVGIGSVS